MIKTFVLGCIIGTSVLHATPTNNVNINNKWKGTSPLVKENYSKVFKKWELKSTPKFYITKYTVDVDTICIEHSRHISRYGACALDINWSKLSHNEKATLIKDFIDVGFTSFGIGNTTLHIDMRESDNVNAWTNLNTMPKWASRALYFGK